MTAEMVPDQEGGPPGSAVPGRGFAAGGPLDSRARSALLAGLADAVTRDGHLPGLTDDELVGVMRAWRRLESWCGAGLLAAVAELARRRPADRTPAVAPGEFPAQVSEFLSDEVAAALTLTSRAADAMCTLGVDLGVRLPVTARALHAGSSTRPRPG
jgi:hypothetical protein